MVVGVLGWLFSNYQETPATNLPWQACLTKWQDGTQYPDLLPVSTGSYALSAASQELKPFLAPHELEKIVIKDPFLIEKHEVSVKAFRRYVAFVEHLDPSQEKERLQSRIGLQWNKEDSDTSPVKGVSWDVAWDYTDWLGQQTGCAYTLPSREQWGATVLLLDGAQNSSSKAKHLNEESLKTLIWGVREWTSSPCTGGYYLAGEDEFVPLPEVRSATCMPAMLSVGGFRVAIKATASTKTTSNQPPAATKP